MRSASHTVRPPSPEPLDARRWGVATVGTALVRALATDEVERYRALRLEALRADPAAFASSYETEVAFDDETWRARLAGFAGRPGVVLVAEDEAETDGPPLGMAGSGLTATPGEATLWGMWVRPAARGSGAAARLVEAAVAWAGEAGAPRVILWVVRTNARAIAAYERAGFVATGDVQADPANPCAAELAMRLDQ